MEITRFPKSGRTSDTLTECNGTNSIRCALLTLILNSCAFNSVSDLEFRIPKECSNYCTIVLISHTSKVMLKILQARLQQYMNCEIPHVQAGLRKGRRTRDQIANICWIIKKEREFQKNIYFCFIDYTKAFDCVDHNKLENS